MGDEIFFNEVFGSDIIFPCNCVAIIRLLVTQIMGPYIIRIKRVS